MSYPTVILSWRLHLDIRPRDTLNVRGGKPWTVIPVIDVAHGQVVHAVEGERSAYRPIETPLANSTEPADLARGLRALFPFRKIYVADLDGIEGRGPQHTPRAVAESGLAAHRDLDRCRDRLARRGARPFSPPRCDAGRRLGKPRERPCLARHRCRGAARTVLSLDFRGGEFMGPEALLDDPSLWPARVIVMTLDRVGSDGGPDVERLQDIASRAGSRRVYAAGGIRDRADLDRDPRSSALPVRSLRRRLHARKDFGRRPQGDRRPLNVKIRIGGSRSS